MTDRRRQIGAYGEEIASQHLQRLGWEILARNWRKRGGELDIVAKDAAGLVFVEVRTRSTRGFGTAEESVDRRKQNQVRKIAAQYLTEVPGRWRQIRFDVIVVYLSGGGQVQEIRHLQNAF